MAEVYYVLKNRVLKGPFNPEQLRAACARGDFQSLDYAITAAHVEQGLIKYIKLSELNLGLQFGKAAVPPRPVPAPAPKAPTVSAAAEEPELSSGFGDDEEAPKPGDVTRVFTEALVAAELMSSTPPPTAKTPAAPRPVAHAPDSPFAPPTAGGDWQSQLRDFLNDLRARALKPALIVGGLCLLAWGAFQIFGKSMGVKQDSNANRLPPPSFGSATGAPTPGSTRLPPPQNGNRLPASTNTAAPAPAPANDNYDPPNPNDVMRQEAEAAAAAEEEARKANARRAKSVVREPNSDGPEGEDVDAGGGEH